MVHVRRLLPPLTGTLVASSLVSVGLFLLGALRNHSFTYAYMVWNLFLAWLPLMFVYILTRTLRTKRWSSWEGIALSLLWLGFLPNSFYMVSDYIHLSGVPRVDLLFDAVLLTSFIVNGLILGFLSLYIVHMELRKRLPEVNSARVVGGVLLLCSFAIYLGRQLRWNTWDVLINPAGILFDVSDAILRPTAHPGMYTTTASFFVLLACMYWVAWNVVRELRRHAA